MGRPLGSPNKPKERDDGRSRERDEPRKAAFQARKGDRQLMGGYTQTLAVDGIPPGYRGRWVNHESNKVQSAINAGYIPALKDGSLGDLEVSGGDLADEEQWITKSVGDTINGKLFAYLMVIKEEWYQEDQRKKQVDIDLFDEAIKTGKTKDASGNMVDDPTTYIAKASIEHNAPLQR